jgi:anti-sigma B factor antagonist
MVRPSFDPDQSVSVGVRVLGAVVVVELSGEIDMATREAVREPLFACVAERPPGLVVDLTKVDFIGSAGIAVLIDMTRRAEQSGTVLRIVAGTPVVLRPLEVSGLLDLLPVCRTLTQALEAVTGTVARR